MSRMAAALAAPALEAGTRTPRLPLCEYVATPLLSLDALDADRMLCTVRGIPGKIGHF